MTFRPTLRSTLPVSPSARAALRSRLAGATGSRAGRVTAAVTAVAVGAGLTTGAAVVGRDTVTLTIDGVSRDITSRADTVAEVLDAAGVEAGERDELVPAAGSAVADGSTITLRRAREVLLTIDGRPRTVRLVADSTAEVLDALALRSGTRASRSGGRLVLTTPKRLTVVVGARRVPLVSAYPTVRQALLQAGVRLAATDRVSPPAESAPQDGQVITVEQVRSAVQREEVRLPYQVVTRTDDGLAEGRRRVLSAGSAGVLLREWTTTYTDGQVTSRTLRSERVLRDPVDRVVVLGTGPRPTAASGTSSSSGSSGSSGSGDGLNWAALAQCESGGNPRAVSSGGTYRGLYQFSMGTWRSVGGQGDPIDASPAEQTRRAQMLYARAGRSPWPHCGSRL